jgi:intracellular sulfur oxidation DsrE/DsrF family protein
MKQNNNKTLLILCFLMISITTWAQNSSEKKFKTQTEVILPVKDFGKIYNVPFATDKPDPNMQYKIVYEASAEEVDSFSLVYPALEFAAKMYNLHVYGGAPRKNLDVVLVIGGPGIVAAMTNEAYRKKYGVDNPNLKILQQLKEAGVKINGCAQSMLKHSIDPSEISPDVTPVFSRFTTVSNLQLKGYAYFRF